jgi:glutathione S-transferase
MEVLDLMKLYFFPVAPNPTKVRLYLAEKAAGGAEIPIEEILVSLPQGQQKQPEHLARNPFGKLPVLELDDGSHLIESLTMIEYLEERYPEPPLIGNQPAERAQVRQLERIAEICVLMPVARLIHATRSPLGLPPKPEVAAEAQEAVPKGLGYFDDILSDGRPFVAGAAPTVADCTLAAALQFARFREIELAPEFSDLIRWDREYRERPSAKSVLVI